MLKELIDQARHENEDAMATLISKFDPLLKKYARLVADSEDDNKDAYQDLVIQLIDLVRSKSFGLVRSDGDAVYIAYIKRTITNYCLNFKKNKSKSVMSTFYSIEDLPDSIKLSVKDDYSYLVILGFKKQLTKTELDIVMRVFLYDERISEIAFHYGVTRQNINQIKNSALSKLRAVKDSF